MQLFNQTPLVARVDTSEVARDQPRIGTVTAKATFRFSAAGHVELETQEPLPLLNADQQTPLGLLPSDFEPRRDPAFEVILLGHAYAPNAHPVESLRVSLSVGAARRELVVFGDRAWARVGQAPPTMTRPLPFTRIPLTYERAFGGTKLAKIDAASEMDLSDPINPHGRGFDAEYWAHNLGQLLRAPPGYPRLDGYRRDLPNLEDPRIPVTRWQDAPEPACWATTPRDVCIHAVRRARGAGDRVDEATQRPADGPRTLPAYEDHLYRAHPDWVIAAPEAAPLIRLQNLVDERANVEFQLLDQRVVADYVIEGRNGTRALTPQMVLLLPDERRFSLLYRMSFTFGFSPGDERAFRLRLEPSWYSGARSQ